MTYHFGSCHCGAIRFQIESDISELTTCDCSLCIKKNALMCKVHESEFQLLAGGDHIAEYQWNTRIARHYFCSLCGVYTFHRKRALPDHYGINVHCLDELDISLIPVRSTDGESMSVVDDHARPQWPGPRISMPSL